MEGLTWAPSSRGQLEIRMELMQNLRWRREEEHKRSPIGRVSKACT